MPIIWPTRKWSDPADEFLLSGPFFPTFYTHPSADSDSTFRRYDFNVNGWRFRLSLPVWFSNGRIHVDLSPGALWVIGCHIADRYPVSIRVVFETDRRGCRRRPNYLDFVGLLNTTAGLRYQVPLKRQVYTLSNPTQNYQVFIDCSHSTAAHTRMEDFLRQNVYMFMSPQTRYCFTTHFDDLMRMVCCSAATWRRDGVAVTEDSELDLDQSNGEFSSFDQSNGEFRSCDQSEDESWSSDQSNDGSWSVTSGEDEQPQEILECEKDVQLIYSSIGLLKKLRTSKKFDVFSEIADRPLPADAILLYKMLVHREKLRHPQTVSPLSQICVREIIYHLKEPDGLKNILPPSLNQIVSSQWERVME